MTGNVDNGLTGCPPAASSPVTVRFESEPIRVPPDRTVQPISERQFNDLVRGYRLTTKDGVQVYSREGKPWRYERRGSELAVYHKNYPLPVEHFFIV